MIAFRESLRRQFLVSFASLLIGLALFSLAFTLGTLYFYYDSTVRDRTTEVSRRFQAALKEAEDALLFRIRILGDVARVEAAGLDPRVVREIQVYTLRWLKRDGLEVLGSGTREYWENRGFAPAVASKAFSGIPVVELTASDEGSPMLLAASPREGPQGISEVIMASLPLKGENLAALAKRSGGEIILQSESGHVLSSSLSHPIEPEQAFRGDHGSMTIGAVPYAYRTLPLELGHRVFGQYTVLWSTADLANLVLLMATLHLGGIVLGSLVFYLLYRRVIAKTATDIERLTDWGGSFSFLSPTPPPSLPRKDELGVLARVFSGLVDGLKGAWEEVEVKNRALEEVNASLEDKVDEKTREAHEQRQLLESVLAGMRQAVFLLEPDETVAYANQAARQAFGEVRGLSRKALVPMSGPSEGPSEAELTRDGRTYLVSSTPVGERGRSVLVAQDVTERRTLEQQLQQAQKLESVGRLAGGVAHDFNNVLGAIVPCVDILRRRLEDPKALACLDTIESATLRAGSVVRQLLTFSRSGQFQPVPLDLNAAVEGAVQLIRPGLKGVNLVWDPAASLPDVRGDETQIQQVILNLVLNAVDAMGGQGAVTVRTAPSSQRGSVLLTVQDEGPGIPKHVVDKIFDPFFTTKEAGKGTGLGLSIVYGVVERHGGKIRVVSAPGKGARFEVELPSVELRAAEDAPSRPARAGLLVVDDDELLLDTVADSLREFGFEVATAKCGAKALEAIASGPTAFDAAVLDVRMPEMDGVELARRIREARPGLPILFMTGYAEDRIADIRSISGRAPLLKPFPAAKLVELLNAALARPSGQQVSA